MPNLKLPLRLLYLHLLTAGRCRDGVQTIDGELAILQEIGIDIGCRQLSDAVGRFLIPQSVSVILALRFVRRILEAVEPLLNQLKIPLRCLQPDFRGEWIVGLDLAIIELWRRRRQQRHNLSKTRFAERSSKRERRSLSFGGPAFDVIDASPCLANTSCKMPLADDAMGVTSAPNETVI